MRLPFPLIRQGLSAQRGQLAEWVPICLAIGIGAYFSLPEEPAARMWVVLCVVSAVVTGLCWYAGENWRPVVLAVLLVSVGAALAGWRAHAVAGPVLEFRFYGPVEGRIVKIDRSASSAVRLTLDRVVLGDVSPSRTPQRVRVSLHGQQGYIRPQPGMRIAATAHLSPPAGPVEPGGYDFQRQAWFQRIGAVGYTRTPVLAIAPAETGLVLAIARARRAITVAVTNALPGHTGAFAAAVTAGDRSELEGEVLDNLRNSNLAHLLAISGLHMGLLTGFVYPVLRYGMALVPGLALRWRTRRLAAVGAVAAGCVYLALSGGNVATVRAFVMVVVVLGAVMLDRRALTLRAVAVAATLILVMQPEALLSPGFQMSFAATTALVATFGALRPFGMGHLPRWLRPVLALVISSAVAGAATAPIAAAHFNRIADYGLIANILSVPLMGMVVVPGAVLAACLAPIGLAGIGFAIMGVGINWILGVAATVSSWPGAVTFVPAASTTVLVMVSAGMLWLILWKAHAGWRLAGIAPVLAGIWLWSASERPDILVSDTGGLVGVMTPGGGRALNKAVGEGFAAESWLMNDGDGAAQDAAFDRAGFEDGQGWLVHEQAGFRISVVSGRNAAMLAAEACLDADIVVLRGFRDQKAEAGCTFIDARMLRDTGALALWLGPKGIEIASSRQASGNRLWNSSEVRRRFDLSQ